MNNTKEIISNILERPGMYMISTDYQGVCNYLLGWEYGGGDLKGFTQWLIQKYDFGNNLTWTSLVMYEACGELDVKTLSDGDNKKSLKKLEKLVLEFISLKEEIGIDGIYIKYCTWYKKQPWYTHEEYQRFLREEPWYKEEYGV